MRRWPGSALRAAEELLARGGARHVAKRHSAASDAGSGASAAEGLGVTADAEAPPPVRVPILGVLGADELRLLVEALLAGRGEAETRAVHRLRCCARALRNVVTHDDVTRHVTKLALGRPYRARRAGFGTALPGRPGAQSRFADLPRQVFVGRRPRPSGVTGFSRREAPYELEVRPPEGSDELRYVNPVLVFDRSTGRYAECVLLMDRRGLLSEILCR